MYYLLFFKICLGEKSVFVVIIRLGKIRRPLKQQKRTKTGIIKLNIINIIMMGKC